MSSELWVVGGVASSVAFLHTLSGPDHYLPFVAMARAGDWTRRRTLWITVLCGIGHVGSSILLALLGVALFRGADSLLHLESFRGDLAAWGLILFGLLYAAWGLRQARRGVPHHHHHVHADGTVHAHEHHHEGAHLHGHGKKLTPWVLFTIFVLGPCEPLIPLLIYTSAEQGTLATIWVAAVFTAITVATMCVVVLLALAGMSRIQLPRLERYSHALAGGAVMACGLAIRFLGL